MDLTHDDVLHILKLIDQSPFGHFSLQTGDLKLEFAKGVAHIATVPANVAKQAAVPDPETSTLPVVPVAPQEAVAGPQPPAASEQGLVSIKAPLLGIVYRRPEPGAPVYVEEGALVEEDTTVALIEVMKLFNPVQAGVRGRIVRVCVENGVLVEYGQELFQVEPLQ